MCDKKNIFNYDENLAVLDKEEKEPNEKQKKVIENEVKDIVKEVVNNVDKKVKENTNKNPLDEAIEKDPFFFT